MLVSDFAKYGGALSSEAKSAEVPSLQIDVPPWMRTGVPTAILSSPALGAFVASGAPCAAPAYRPRADIGFAAEQRRAALYPLIASIACEYGLPVGLFDALIAQESRYQHNAVSSAGAIGLAQLMPGTARYLGVSNPWTQSRTFAAAQDICASSSTSSAELTLLLLLTMLGRAASDRTGGCLGYVRRPITLRRLRRHGAMLHGKESRRFSRPAWGRHGAFSARSP